MEADFRDVIEKIIESPHCFYERFADSFLQNSYCNAISNFLKINGHSLHPYQMVEIALAVNTYLQKTQEFTLHPADSQLVFNLTSLLLSYSCGTVPEGRTEETLKLIRKQIKVYTDIHTESMRNMTALYFANAHIRTVCLRHMSVGTFNTICAAYNYKDVGDHNLVIDNGTANIEG